MKKFCDKLFCFLELLYMWPHLGFLLQFCFSCCQWTTTTARRGDHHSQRSRAPPRCHHLVGPQHWQARFTYKLSVLLLASSDSKDLSFAWHWVCKNIGTRPRLIPCWWLQCHAGRVVESHHWSSSACARCSSSGRQWNSQVQPSLDTSASLRAPLEWMDEWRFNG